MVAWFVEGGFLLCFKFGVYLRGVAKEFLHGFDGVKIIHGVTWRED
jgi:hypothetical protein